MNRQEVYQDIESKLGLVPAFFKSLPDATLELEWKLMQQVQMTQGVIPARYRELIGLSVAAATRCPYTVELHTQLARLMGATDAEIDEALAFARASTGWSVHLNGAAPDLEQFKDEIRQIAGYLRRQGTVPLAHRAARPPAEAPAHHH